jgi:hypothetical protein
VIEEDEGSDHLPASGRQHPSYRESAKVTRPGPDDSADDVRHGGNNNNRDMDSCDLHDRRRVLQALCASAAAAGCSLVSPGPLEHPPAWFDPTASRAPMVFVHGAFGSRLRDRRTRREIWPVGVPELLVGSFDRLELPLDPETGAALEDDIEAFDLFDSAGLVEFYGSLIGMLAVAGGYRRASPDAEPRDDRPCLYTLLYDWRRDLSRAAGMLDQLIEKIRSVRDSPDLKVDLVAHSSGGLLVRYYLLYGPGPLPADGAARPDFAGAAKVGRVVAIGVPEIGMARAAATLCEGEPIVLGRVGPQVMLAAESSYQLLPQGDDVWLLDARGGPIPRAACDLEVWREHGMGVFDPRFRAQVRAAAGGRNAGRARVELLERGFRLRLDRARRFHAAIRAAPIPDTVPYYSIGGDCLPTQARLLIERTGSRTAVRSRPEDVGVRRPQLDYSALMLEMGDGMVTRSSASCRPLWPVGGAGPASPARNWRWQEFVCASHNRLAGNVECQRALLRALDDGTARQPARGG